MKFKSGETPNIFLVISQYISAANRCIFTKLFTHAGNGVPDNVQWSKYTRPVVKFRVGAPNFLS